MTNPTVPTAQPGLQFVGRIALIVDDEPVIRMIARTALAAVGFAVVEAGDGASATQAISQATKPFDLILLDLTLTDSSGTELIPQIRELTPPARILVVSGLGPEEGVGIGADGFLNKPFTKATLLMAVTQTLNPPATPSPP